MGLSSKTIEGKILGILFPITVFIVCGYEHCIANMFFLPLGLMGEGVLVSKFMSMFSNLVPVTIGNIIGGLIVVLFHPKSGEKMAKLMSDQTSAEKK
jgi:formate/nitrite transporter FocA (FNT family)